MNDLQLAEKTVLEQALAKYNSQKGAARSLGIPRSTFISKCKRLGIERGSDQVIQLPANCNLTVEIIKKGADFALRIRME